MIAAAVTPAPSRGQDRHVDGDHRIRIRGGSRTCRYLQLLAEFDTRRGWAGPGLRSCVHWSGWRTGLSARTAREQLRVAHALTALPATTAAFGLGRISYSEARAITRIATPESEERLLAVAQHGTTGQLEDVVRAARPVLDPGRPTCGAACTRAVRRTAPSWSACASPPTAVTSS